MKQNRIVIYPKDILIITGRGIRYAQRMRRIIRKQTGKREDQYVTIDEFCQFSGLTRKDVEEIL